MITSTKMRELERLAEKKGIMPEELMKNAGQGVFEIIDQKYGFKDKHAVIFAGHGNNGGDGFVLAKHCNEVCQTLVLFLGHEHKLSKEAQKHYDNIKDLVPIINIINEEDFANFKFQKGKDLIIFDAMIGTGITGKIKEPIASAVDFFNKTIASKIAVDVPTGIHPDTGDIQDKHCECDLIVTFHDIKNGLEKYKDKIVVVDIGLNGLEEKQLEEDYDDDDNGDNDSVSTKTQNESENKSSDIKITDTTIPEKKD